MLEDLNPTTDEFLPLRDVVFHKLRQAILTGELQPGERLMEIHLASRLGVSRTPVREAIHKLEREGLVIMTPRRGAEVASITAKGLQDVLEVRRSLDALCGELACDRISPEKKVELKQAQEEFERATKGKDIREMARKDAALHDIIVEATGNDRLVQLVNQLAEQMYRYRFEYLKDPKQYEKLVEEHKDICDSIISGDKETACKAAKVHIDNQEKSIMEQIHFVS